VWGALEHVNVTFTVMVNLGIAYESSDEEDVAPTVDPEVWYSHGFQGDVIATNGNTSQKPVVNGKLAGRTLPGGSGWTPIDRVPEQHNR
jgi:hypothetical protein